MRARLTVGELAHQQADKPYNTGAISTTNCVKDVFKVFVSKPYAQTKGFLLHKYVFSIIVNIQFSGEDEEIVAQSVDIPQHSVKVTILTFHF